MISRFDNVKISYMLHKLIYIAEADLIAVTKYPSFLQKSILLKTLLYTRVRFARFLVVYRWSKLNHQAGIGDSQSNVFIYDKYISNFYYQLKSYRSKIQYQDFNLTIPYNINSFFRSRSFTEMSNKKNIFQILCSFLSNYKTINHIHEIHVIKKYIIINACPHYHLIMKIKERLCHIVRVNLYWDKDFNFPPGYIKELIAQLDPIEMERPNELYRIDSFLFSFHVINFFGKIIQKLIEHADSFKVQILREISNSISIVFPESYQPFNRFILRINPDSNRIEINSEAPLSILPKDPQKINEVFGKLDTDTFIPMSIYNRTISLYENFNALELLSEIRDLVFYTSVQHFWFFLKSALRSSVFPQFRLRMICKANSIFYISIFFHDKKGLLMTIIFQSIDGMPIFIPISNYYKFNKRPSFPDVPKIFNSMFIHFIEHIDYAHIFKPHIFSLMREFNLYESVKYRFNFSFSDHFYIEKYNKVNYPSLKLRSIDSPENLNPRTILVKQLIRKALNESDIERIVTNLSITSKIYLILLEVERKLKLKGIFSKRSVNTIYIPSMGCKFKIDINEYWSITFEKPFFQFVSGERIIIAGNKLSLRFVDRILNLLDDYFTLGWLIYGVRFNITYINDQKIYLNSFGYHFCISVEPFNYDYYLNGHLSHFLKVFSFRYPSIHMRVMMYTPFSNFSQYINNEDKLLSYFSCSIFYQLKICQIFKSDKWKVVPFVGEDSFTLIYDNILSMVFHKISNDSRLVASVSIIGFSALLLVPLSQIFELHENKTPIITIKMKVFDLEKAKIQIEKFDELIKAFKLLKIDHLYYNKGRVMGKGTRFYLVQTILDINGIIVSSPSFPSLVKITTSIYNMDISFEAKKKIYNFILAMLLFNDKYIVNTLNLFNQLIDPLRIKKLNWEQMAGYMKIDSTNYTFEMNIIEDQKNLHLIFDDPDTESVLIRKDGKEKRLPAREFDEVYMRLHPELSIRDQFRI